MRTTIVIETLDVIENIPLQILEGMIGPSVGPFLLEIFEKGFADGDIYPPYWLSSKEGIYHIIQFF